MPIIQSEISKLILQYNDSVDSNKKIINPILFCYGSVADNLCSKKSDIDLILFYENPNIVVSNNTEKEINEKLSQITGFKVSLQAKVVENSKVSYSRLKSSTETILLTI